MLNILITGASSGIGKATKDYFLENGHKVYAIDINSIEKHDNLVSFICDITSEKDLNSINHYLKENDIKLDAIINVAGIHKMASLVENDYNEIKKLIDINLLGTMLVNRVFYSSLTSNGRILIVTSEVAPFDPLPFNGLYSISKTGLDAYAQALRQELNLVGQKVVTIRPGAIETPLSNNSLSDTQKLANSTMLYKKQANSFLKIATKFMGKPIKPYKLAKLIYKATTIKRPKIIYSKHVNVGLMLLSILPKRMQCWIIKMMLNK